MILVGIVVAAGVLGASAHLGYAGLAAGVVVAAFWYRHDVKRHPRVRCRVCAGSGDEHSRIGGSGQFRRPFGNCWCCGGRKAHPRLALRIVDPGRHRDIKNEIARAKGKT